jgi:hypothetical protein
MRPYSLFPWENLNPPNIHDKSIVRIITTDGRKLFRIKYRYEFKDRDTVFLDGAGLLPGSSDLEYFSTGADIVFRNSPDGPVIASVPFVDPQNTSAVLTGLPSQPNSVADIPRKDDFPSFGTNEKWSYRKTFAQSALAVLAERQISCQLFDSDSFHYIMTEYFYLHNIPSTVRVKMALLLSHPYKDPDGTWWFRIQHLLRQRRIKEPDRWSSQDIRPEAEEISNKLVDEIKREILAKGKI